MWRRVLLVALAGLVLAPASPARADWWSDAARAKRGLANSVAREWLTPDEAADYRAILTRSSATWRQLPGARSTNLAAVLHDVAAQSGSYIAPRALALFSMLDLNSRYLGSDAMPPDGTDILDADGVVYRAFGGHGLQFHPLANFARLNSLLAREDGTGAATLAAALLSRAIPRSGSLVWEYYFPFGGGRPPWTSGMAQAVAARALAADGDLAEARRAFLALSRLTFPLAAGTWIRLYSFSNLTVLNAQLQTALSLADYGRINSDLAATQLSERLLDTTNALFPRFDTGAWSRYSLGGAESPLNYHVYVVGLLRRIAAATADPLWAARATRFDRYTSEPPQVSVHVPSRPVKASAAVRFWLSKISRVTLSIGGSPVAVTLSRGLHTLTWNAVGRRPGRYTGSLTAVDLAGNRTVATLPPIRVARRSSALP
jgi:hypothetical protein